MCNRPLFRHFGTLPRSQTQLVAQSALHSWLATTSYRDVRSSAKELSTCALSVRIVFLLETPSKVIKSERLPGSQHQRVRRRFVMVARTIVLLATLAPPSATARAVIARCCASSGSVRHTSPFPSGSNNLSTPAPSATMSPAGSSTKTQAAMPLSDPGAASWAKARA